MFEDTIHLTRDQAISLAKHLEHPDTEEAKRREEFIKDLINHPEDTVDWEGLDAILKNS